MWNEMLNRKDPGFFRKIHSHYSYSHEKNYFLTFQHLSLPFWDEFLRQQQFFGVQNRQAIFKTF